MQFFLRDKAMRVEEALPHVGTRHDKFYYKVISASDSAATLILEATRVPAASPAQHLQEATLGSHAYVFFFFSGSFSNSFASSSFQPIFLKK